MMDRTTHSTSKAIFILPKFLWIVSEIAFTKASPAFKMTFAITDREIPKPRMPIPIKTNVSRIG